MIIRTYSNGGGVVHQVIFNNRSYSVYFDEKNNAVDFEQTKIGNKIIPNGLTVRSQKVKNELKRIATPVFKSRFS
jgi:hypothetical protein